ncbi:hypothetical protein BKA56DRAFT_478796 [Ilyonectria sp. MPI-CAGE-AT-0026]|nr:hypothetical protein BKA56DRAFT_478796 [Ilyonectria sp. MPI-CAGE-AT-0026]
MAPAKRPVRVANCSGASSDPGYHMYNQAKYGDVDVITGDYLAEVSLAGYSDALTKGEREAFAATAWDGISKTVDLANEKRIKIIVNGGALNPRGLAEKCRNLVKEKGLNLQVAYVDGDNLLDRVQDLLKSSGGQVIPHLDSQNKNIKTATDTDTFFGNPKQPIICANTYLGYRAIAEGLKQGCDIIICGRVADASPVIAAAAWWHEWPETDFDALAGAFVAGHLIECSTYSTGANFPGFDKFDLSQFVDLGCPIVEISASGEAVLTKHEALNGLVNEDTTKCQLLYELQGNIYLNSDVAADVTNIKIKQEAKNRVHISGVRGFPPPPTTKLAIFYIRGYQGELTVNATGYATERKYALQEAQVRDLLKQWGAEDKLQTLEFQSLGIPKPNPQSQLESTTTLRIFAQALEFDDCKKVFAAWQSASMQHFPGMHCTTDQRTAVPKPYVGYYPALVNQTEIKEAINILEDGSDVKTTLVGPPKVVEPLKARASYETTDPSDLERFGKTELRPLGDVALARSGDKGANVNIGIFVHTDDEWEWLRSFLTGDRMKSLMGQDWKDWFFVERVEMPHIKAVHFVIYGALGRGVCGSARLDSLGKGFAEYIRDVHVPVPTVFLQN